jgi:hypothetical protein
LIWNPCRFEIPASETSCPFVNFFCSKSHIGKWKLENSKLGESGQSIFLNHAYPKIRERWINYGKTIQVR